MADKKKTVCHICNKGYQNLTAHVVDVHLMNKICKFCEKEFSCGDSLLCHIKFMHLHLVGYLPLSTQLLKALPTEPVKINGGFLLEKFNQLGINWKGKTKLFTCDGFLILWDLAKNRPVLSYEILNCDTLKINPGIDTADKRMESDDDLPDDQVSHDVINSAGFDCTHLAVARYHQSTQKSYDETHKRKNFVPFDKAANRDILKRLESHICIVGNKYPPNSFAELLTLCLYDDDDKAPFPKGLDVEVQPPTHLAKVLLLPEGEQQVFLVKNKKPSEHHPWTNFCSSIDDVMTANCQVQLSFSQKLSWVGDKYKCKDCRSTFMDLMDKKFHEWYRHKDMYCPGCRGPKTGLSPSHHRNHILTAHKLHICDVCEMIFFKRFNLTRHLEIHEEITYECEICNHTMKTTSAYRMHMSRNHENKQVRELRCVKCSKTFQSQTALMNHEKSAHNKASADSDGENSLTVQQTRQKPKRARLDQEKEAMKIQILELQRDNTRLMRENNNASLPASPVTCVINNY